MTAPCHHPIGKCLFTKPCRETCAHGPAANLAAAQAPDLSQQYTTTVGPMSLHATSADYWLAQAEANARDAARLDWMSQHEAWIGWNREGDMCRVFVLADDIEDLRPKPVCGWQKFFDNHRDAIDAAMTAREQT